MHAGVTAYELHSHHIKHYFKIQSSVMMRSLEFGLMDVTAVHEYLGSESAVEAVRNVMPQLDASDRSLAHSLSIQHNELCAVGLRNVELDKHKPIVLFTFTPTLQTEAWHKYRFPHTAMGIPYLPLPTLTVVLQRTYMFRLRS